MTKRERFLAFANFEKVDRVPRRCSFVPYMKEKILKYTNGQDPEVFFDMDGLRGQAGLTPPPDFKKPDYSRYYPDKVNGKDGFYIDGNGCGHQTTGFYHFSEYISPLRNATSFKELEEFPIVSNEGWSDEAMKKVCQETKANGYASFIFVGHMYENAWQVRGYEQFLEDLMVRRDWAEYLLDKYCANNTRTAEAAAKAGYDCIAIGDDVANQNAMMFAPDLWREVMKPRWAKVIAAAKKINPKIHVWYHSDGNIWDILDDIIEIGITILNPVQPECMNPVEVRKRCGKHLAFDGCVGTQTTFPFGTPADMERTVRSFIEELEGEKGGLMLSPTHVLEPEVPVENVVAFFEAVDEVSKERCR